MDKVYFRTFNNKPFTQKEYIYIVNYKYNNPNKEISLCLDSPTEENKYTHLIASMGIPLLWVRADGLRLEEMFEIYGEEITDANILSFPMFVLAEYVSRKVALETTILDLGCGNKGISKQLPGKVTTLDIFPKFNPDILWDLTKPLPLKDNSYDVILLLDVIEHVDRESGARLLDEIKRVAKKRIIISTPLYWTPNDEETNNPQSEYYGNKYNLHRSLWNLMDFEEYTRVYNVQIKDNQFFGYWEK